LHRILARFRRHRRTTREALTLRAPMWTRVRQSEAGHRL
jgi:hypothetical protein